MSYIDLRKYYGETLGQNSLSVIRLENGVRTKFLNIRVPVEDRPVHLRLYIQSRQSWFEQSYDGEKYKKTGYIFNITRFSSEYCRYGKFIGAMAGVTCADRIEHAHYADFDLLEYVQEQGE